MLELAGDIQRFVARCPIEDVQLCSTLDSQGLELSARFDSVSVLSVNGSVHSVIVFFNVLYLGYLDFLGLDTPILWEKGN